MPNDPCGKTIAKAVFIVTAVVATLGAGMTPAEARDLFHWVDGLFSGGPTRASRSAPKHHPRTARKLFRHELRTSAAPSTPEAGLVHAAPEQPLFLIASIADQRVSVYNHQGLVSRSAISTGVTGHPTPEGIFTIIGRERYHRSNIYSAAPMPFMQRITWSGIAMHLGVVPGHPASHGCIRLPSEFAAKLWGWTKIGERVVISTQDITPAEFAHPLLLTPKLRKLTDADAMPGFGFTVPLQPINPFQYADFLKMKAAAATQNVKETTSAVGLKRREVARAETELKSAEKMQAFVRSKADAAARATKMAKAEAAAKQQKLGLVTDAFNASAGDALSEARIVRLAKAYLEAMENEDAAALSQRTADATLAGVAARLEAAKTALALKTGELGDVLRRFDQAKTAFDAAANAEKEARRRAAPLSVLVSKKDLRIYVRQGLAPVFDAPVSLRDPQRSLGSHLYIATAAGADGVSLKWSVVSMPNRDAEERHERRTETASVSAPLDSPANALGSASSPAEALERIEIPQDVRDRIAERLWIGGSLIISDLPLSGETGKVGTDLTVKIR